MGLAGQVGLAGLLRRWRRSLQLRVISAALTVSVVVVAVLGVLLLQQVDRGLLAAKRRAALAEADSGLAYAQAQLAQSDRNSAEAQNQLLETLAATLDARGNGIDAVGLLPSSPGGVGFYDRYNFNPADVPSALRRVVVQKQVVAGAYATGHPGSGPASVPELIVGAPLVTPGGQSYQLYFAFPLSAESSTLDLVRRTLAVAGAVLVLLLAGLVALLTRQVLAPVRVAAGVADRLAAGRLSERVTVRGQDEIARLGTAFNAMAAGLQRQIRELEELSRVQRRFVSDVSHELRTPLTTVRMAADLLHEARDGFAPAVARSAELLNGELDRFESLLADLLEISRFDARVATLETEHVDLAGLVRGEAAGVALLCGDGMLDLSGVPAGRVLAELDPRRVQRILRNLLSNAVDHGEGRPIRVTVAADEHAVAVVVRDHGVGLRPGESSLVFARFWRADPSRARRTGGTGLGLAIALEDARLHGGWLQAYGEPGVGAAFRLVLPRVAGTLLTAAPLALSLDEQLAAR